MKDAVWSCAMQTLAALLVAVFARKLSWIPARETQSPIPCLMWISLQWSHKQTKHTSTPHTPHLQELANKIMKWVWREVYTYIYAQQRRHHLTCLVGCLCVMCFRTPARVAYFCLFRKNQSDGWCAALQVALMEGSSWASDTVFLGR